MNPLHKILTGLILVLSVSLNANATFGPATMSISEPTVSTDMATRSSLLLAVSDDVNDDVNSGVPSNDDNGNDDNGNDDNGNDDNGNDDNSNDDSEGQPESD